MAQGLWWLPLAAEAGAVGPLPGTSSALAEAAGDGGAELLRAAAAQRMNTETRRAVFCVVMGAQDCADASERLLRLPLKASASSLLYVKSCQGAAAVARTAKNCSLWRATCVVDIDRDVLS